MKPDSQGAAPSRRGYDIAIAAVAVLLAFSLVHGSRFLENLSVVHWEDIAFARHNAANIHSLRDCFTQRPLWPGLYRPLTTNLYYYLGGVVFDNRIEVYHCINAFLYLANALLLYFICRRLLPGWWALVPPVLFVSRLSHVEVIINTCEFQTLLAVCLSLTAIWLFMSARQMPRQSPKSRLLYTISLVCYVLALLSKETALVLPAILLAYGLMYDKRRAWRLYAALAAVTAGYILLFRYVLRGVTDYEPTGFSFNTGLNHILAGFASYLLAFINLVTYRLESVVMVPAIPGLAASWPARALFAAACAVCAAYMALRAAAGGGPPPDIERGQVNLQNRGADGTSPGKYRLWGDAMAWGFAFFVAASSPYVILKSRLFMRYGYAGHAGLAIAAGAVLCRLAGMLAGRMGAGE